MIKDKDVAAVGEELRELTPEKLIDINEGILNLLDLKVAKNLDNLLVRMADCCLQYHSSLDFE
nr:hypothetical protein 11 [bacterium]